MSVIGSTGSGKSVLARRLSDEWNLPLYDLDAIFWSGEEGALAPSEFSRAVSQLTKRDAWVLDGHYRAVREQIWRRSDMVVWLNYPLWLVAFRLLRRFAQKRRAADGRGTSDTVSGARAPGAPAQTSARWRERLGRLARTIRERGEYGRLLNAPEYRHIQVVELMSLRQTEDLIRSTSGRPTRSPDRSSRTKESLR